jgi:putative addiction module killer protein
VLTVVYTIFVFEITQSETFRNWLSGLKDRKAVAKINARLSNMSLGNLGDVKPIGEGVSESRINYGPGYRIYFKQNGPVVVVVLAGGSKRTQQKDIKTAKNIANEYT